MGSVWDTSCDDRCALVPSQTEQLPRKSMTKWPVASFAVVAGSLKDYMTHHLRDRGGAPGPRGVARKSAPR